jgi:hypothetical protein
VVPLLNGKAKQSMELEANGALAPAI